MISTLEDDWVSIILSERNGDGWRFLFFLFLANQLTIGVSVVVVEVFNAFVGSAVKTLFRWFRNKLISFGRNEAIGFRNCFWLRFGCFCAPNGFRCFRFRCLFVVAMLLSIWLLCRWCTLSMLVDLLSLGRTAPTSLCFGFFFGFLVGRCFFFIWWCCFPIRFFSTCSNPCRYSLKRSFVNLVSISSTSSTSSDVILWTRLLLLRNVSRLSIISLDRITGIFMPVLLMAVSISHSKFFARINKYSSARVLLMLSLRMVSCRNCFHLKYWNAPTYTCVSIWRFRKWIYWINEKNGRERKGREEKLVMFFSKSSSRQKCIDAMHLHLNLGASGFYAYWKRIKLAMLRLLILATIYSMYERFPRHDRLCYYG